MERTKQTDFSRIRIAVLTYTFLFVLLNELSVHGQTVDLDRKGMEPTGVALPLSNSTSDTVRSGSTAVGPGKVSDSLLRIGIGDLVEMSVFDVPELTSKARITSDGNGYFPLIGYVHLAGLRAEEAQRVIESKLSAFVRKPNVSFVVDEYASEGVSVMGEVAKPGVYPFRGEPRLFDLISSAGGLTEKAGHTVTITHENDPDNSVNIELSRTLADNAQVNLSISPHDTIVVHKADIVYVVGEVGRPSGLLMDRENLTVLRAIALAGGTTRTAKLTGVKILRNDGGHVSEQPVPLKKILAAKAQDVVLEADDIVVVPASAGKVLAGRTLEAALQAATLVTVAAVQ